jgi:hypothetical protein
MRKVSLRRLLSKLTVLALASSPAAATAGPAPSEQRAAADADADADADLDAELPIDREHLDPRDAAMLLGRTLAQALAEMRPISATHLATTWALSNHPLRRAGIAHALEWAFPVFGDDVILDHLSRDPDPMIRCAVARAAWVRRRSGGDLGVLARLAGDPDPDVRAIASRAG